MIEDGKKFWKHELWKWLSLVKYRQEEVEAGIN